MVRSVGGRRLSGGHPCAFGSSLAVIFSSGSTARGLRDISRGVRVVSRSRLVRFGRAGLGAVVQSGGLVFLSMDWRQPAEPAAG